MNLETLELLLTSTGEKALQAAHELKPSEAKYPACYDRLRKGFTPELARAALDIVLLREKARVKFARAEEMFFTRESLEMASGEIIGAYRASRYLHYPIVADLCCGIGGDTLALASAGRSVVAVDQDPVRLRMAQANLAVHGLTGQFICGNALSVELPHCDAIFADPGRRPGGRRSLSVHDSEPSVPALLERFAHQPLGVKIAPGVSRDELNQLNITPEFLSVNGELKECMLWLGELRSPTARAVLLPGPHILTGSGELNSEVGPVEQYLYDPDPAVTRADLVDVLGNQLGAKRIDPGIALLTSSQFTDTPFAEIYQIVECLTFDVKRVGAWLKEHSIGRITPIKRGSIIDTDLLQKQWKLKGLKHQELVFTKISGRNVVLIGQKCPRTMRSGQPG